MSHFRRSTFAVAAALCAVAMSAQAEAPRSAVADSPSFSESARAHLPPAAVDAARDARDFVVGKDEVVEQSNDPTQLTVVPAVPEPETYALMAAGLGALGVMARRRKLMASAGR